MDVIKFVQEEMMKKPDFPQFAPGDNIIVTYKIIEGEKERSQSFKGDVIKREQPINFERRGKFPLADPIAGDLLKTFL